MPDEAQAADLYRSLIDVTVGSALTTARAEANAEQSDELLAKLDTAAHPETAAMSLATSRTDRDAHFERTLRVLLDAAT